MTAKRIAAVAAVILVQAGYLRHVEQRHREMVSGAIAHVEARILAVESVTTAQLSPTWAWRRDVKRRLKRIERCGCGAPP